MLRSEEAMICIGKLKKKFISFRNFCSKAEKLSCLCFHICVKKSYCKLFYEDFRLNSYSVDSNEAMKQGDEALNASLLKFLTSNKSFIASLLKFLLSIKSFIAITL
jgi:hypothetical protein